MLRREEYKKQNKKNKKRQGTACRSFSLFIFGAGPSFFSLSFSLSFFFPSSLASVDVGHYHKELRRLDHGIIVVGTYFTDDKRSTKNDNSRNSPPWVPFRSSSSRSTWAWSAWVCWPWARSTRCGPSSTTSTSTRWHASRVPSWRRFLLYALLPTNRMVPSWP